MGSRTNRRGGALGGLALTIGMRCCAVVLVLFSALAGASGGGEAGASCGASADGRRDRIRRPRRSRRAAPSAPRASACWRSPTATPSSAAPASRRPPRSAGCRTGRRLQITVGRRSVIAYKQDIGLGGGPIDGHPRAIDLWWELAAQPRHPLRARALVGHGQIASVSADCVGAGGAGGGQSAGAGATAGERAASDRTGSGPTRDAARRRLGGRAALGSGRRQGDHRRRQPDRRQAVRLRRGHGLPLDMIAPYYDCSSSVAHLLYGGGLLPVDADMTSADFESLGASGPRALGDDLRQRGPRLHVRRRNALGHARRRRSRGRRRRDRLASARASSAGFVVRHPAGL